MMTSDNVNVSLIRITDEQAYLAEACIQLYEHERGSDLESVDAQYYWQTLLREYQARVRH